MYITEEMGPVPLEILTAALCGIVLITMVVMLLAALPGIVDPTTFTRCHDCSRWMIDTRHQPDAVCFHCRHAHQHHLHLPFTRH
jgi:hypothetical protein